MQTFKGAERCGNSVNRRPGQVCVFSAGFASLMGVQFHLRLWIMQPGSLVLPEVRRWGKPWDRVYRYLHSKRRLPSLRDQTCWKRMRMTKIWRPEKSRWPLSIDMFLLQCYLMCNHLVTKHSTHLFNLKREKDEMPLRLNHISPLFPSVTCLQAQAKEAMLVLVFIV